MDSTLNLSQQISYIFPPIDCWDRNVIIYFYFHYIIINIDFFFLYNKMLD